VKPDPKRPSQGEPHSDWMFPDGSIDEKLGKSYKEIIK